MDADSDFAIGVSADAASSAEIICWGSAELASDFDELFFEQALQKMNISSNRNKMCFFIEPTRM